MNMTDDFSSQLVSAVRIDSKVAGLVIGRYVLKRLMMTRRTPEQKAERALANSIARRHDEDMRQKALEYSMGWHK
jgi:hypothetical protein